MLHIFISLLSFLATSAYAPQAANDIVGTWLTEEKDGKVEIYRNGNRYYGKVVWLDPSLSPKSGPMLDVNNPDPKKQNRPLIGLNLLTSLEYNAEEKIWENGEIYDPKTGNTYSVFLRLESKDVLYLKGYIGFSLIGRSTLWKRIK